MSVDQLGDLIGDDHRARAAAGTRPATTTAGHPTVHAEDSYNPGSLGVVISDAVADAAGRSDTHYSLGSVLNHVLPPAHPVTRGFRLDGERGHSGPPARC